MRRRIWLAMAVAFASACIAEASEVRPSDRVTRNVVIRSAPTTASAPLGALAPGEQLELEASLAGWHKVRLASGAEGYVSKSWTIVTGAARRFLVHAIDVGTGLALFVEGADFTLLYDGGSNDDEALGPRNRLTAYLRAVRPNLSTIDHVVLSHPHQDHVELLADVLAAYQVRHVWDSGRLHDICGYRAFLEAAAAEPGLSYHNAIATGGVHEARFEAKRCRGTTLPATTVRIARAGAITNRLAVSLGRDARLLFLNADGRLHHSPNDNSLVARLDLGAVRILLMGDAEAGGRKAPAAPPDPRSIEGRLIACCAADLGSRILVVGHHGSMTSSRWSFLSAVGARDYIVSSGPKKYRTATLPDPVMVDEFERRGTLWRTDLDDAGCARAPAKIGPDADNQPGGCDNILVTIDGTRTTLQYVRRGD